MGECRNHRTELARGVAQDKGPELRSTGPLVFVAKASDGPERLPCRQSKGRRWSSVGMATGVATRPGSHESNTFVGALSVLISGRN